MLKKILEKVKKKYREMSRLFRLMADNIPELVWAKDLKGRFLFVNKADAEFLGAKDTEEPIGKDDMYFARRYRAERPDRNDWFTFGELCVNSDEIVLKTKKPGRFDEFGNVRGKFLYLDVWKAPMFDENGRLIGTVGFGRDVTKEKKIENKLKESEEKYRRIFEESQDVLFITSIEGKIIDINPAGLKFFGYDSLDEIKKINIINDLYKNPDDRDRFIKEIKEKGSIKDFEIIFKRKDGEEVVGLISATPIFNGKNEIKGFRGTIRDITDKKQLEIQLLQAQKLESIGRLAGGIAHDFNNILTVINGYAEIALNKIYPEHPLYKDISSILNAGFKAQNLINQLLAFSRRQIYKPEVVDINRLILSMKKMLQRLIGEDIEINIYTSNNIPYIKADRSQIEQILINLFVNAKDALNEIDSPFFKKKIILKTGYKYFNKEDIVKYPGIVEGDYVYFSVSDNGIGMDEETKRKIFEPFFTTKEKGRGTGLGLSMIYGIVKQNKGYIYVDSEPQKGTTFKIFWPATVEKDIHYKDKKINKIYSGKGNILIVEDSDEVRKFIVEALTAIGYNVFNVKNGIEALNFFKNKDSNIDLIITDIVMPEINGIELVKKIKEFYPDVKVIFISGYTENNISFEIFPEEINFIQKPFTLKILSNIVKKVLNNKKNG